MLQMLEQMRVGGAHWQHFLALLEADFEIPPKTSMYATYRTNVNDDAAMHLPKQLRIQSFLHQFECRGQQKLRGCSEHGRVFVIGLEVKNVLHHNESHAAGVRDIEPFDEFSVRAGEASQ